MAGRLGPSGSSFRRSSRPASSAWRPTATASPTENSSSPTSSRPSSSRQTDTVCVIIFWAREFAHGCLAAGPLPSMAILRAWQFHALGNSTRLAILRAWPCAYSPRSAASQEDTSRTASQSK
ncbi:hypothetical protein PtB15_6B500 [Puccinia triticina]|nr:hypothetical protein PtB15_6B500 [Puccinia triticina]